MSMKYRADIDGLRTLAVLSVILFHLNPNWLPNGYLGVDIFFVLSGFLITSIIYREMMENTFSITRFYMRRMKRILPAFFVVLFFSLFIGYFLFEFGDLKTLYNSAFSAVVFLTNLYFARNTGYFDASSDEKPLLHFWSLAVEEQFYFIFPLLLLAIFSHKTLFNKRWWIFIGGLLILLLSPLFPIPLEHYYLSHFRFIEMLSGALLAVFSYEVKFELSKINSLIMSGVSLLLILSLLNLEYISLPSVYFSIFLFFVAILCTLLILGNSQNHIISSFFSIKPIVWIGKLSYSLYLWHWVVLAFARYLHQQSELPLSWIFICIPIIFTLSVLSYYLIETPLRHSKIKFKMTLLYYFVIPALSVVTIRSVVLSKRVDEGFKSSYESQACYQNLNQECLIGKESNHKILLIGDSHSLHLLGMAEVIANRQDLFIHLSAANGCPFILGYNFIDKGNVSNTEFCSIRNPVFNLEKLNEYSKVIISNFWSNKNYIQEPDFYYKFELMLEKLADLKKPVYIVNSTGYTLYSPYRLEQFKNLGINFLAQPSSLFKPEIDEPINKIRQSVEKYPQFKWIDLRGIVQEIVETKPELKMFFDDNHLTIQGSKAIGEFLIKEQPDLFKY